MNAPLKPAAPHATLACIEMAHRLAPPQAVIHIGAGQGHGVLHQWQHWQVKHARVIDADNSRLQWLHTLIAAQPEGVTPPDWQALAAVVADHDGEVDFHHVSNPAEDGLLSVGALLGLWPNLHALPHHPRPARRLDTLLAEYPLPRHLDNSPGAHPTWLIIDCLPALRILQGATRTLPTVGVVCLRAVLDPARLDDPAAGLAAATHFLAEQGFMCVHVGETNHPAVGEALFLRDETTALQAEHRALQQQLAQFAHSVDQLTHARDQHAQLATDRQAQLDTLSQAKTALTAERDTLAQEKATLATERDALNAQKAQLTQALEAAEQAKADALAAREAEAKAKTEALAARDAETQAKAV
ncbi:MAG: hypothetical protein JSS57_22170, partial [Proteobacteria bacterium]|nr:hypothetical protein [Pseudomonadota bacterium]